MKAFLALIVLCSSLFASQLSDSVIVQLEISQLENVVDNDTSFCQDFFDSSFSFQCNFIQNKKSIDKIIAFQTLEKYKNLKKKSLELKKYEVEALRKIALIRVSNINIQLAQIKVMIEREVNWLKLNEEKNKQDF
jgi:uncharacterized UBP type Zn finger protein